MKIVVIFLALVAVAIAVSKPNRSHHPVFRTNIIGGEEAKEKEFPFYVTVEIPFFGALLPVCGGAIYDETRIITSASCVQMVASNSMFIVAAGTHNITNLSGEEQNRTVISYVVHKDYNSQTYKNDIGILTLNSPLILTDRVKPIHLAQSTSAPYGDVVICGYGFRKFDELEFINLVMQKATLKVISRYECNQAFGNEDCNLAFRNVKAPAITNSMVCAVAPETGICSADEGSVLIAKDEDGLEYLAGVGSFIAEPCGEYPSVFTAIAPYRKWLDSKLNA